MKIEKKTYHETEHLEETCNMSYRLATETEGQHDWTIYREAEAIEAAYACMSGPSDHMNKTIISWIRRDRATS